MLARFHKKFAKRLEKLPLKIEDAFYARLEIFLVNKFDQRLNNHELEGEYAGYKSINVTGDYRAIFQDFGDNVLFITIGTHSELY
ncbi:MAG: type II toxin-antitoxin system mRNA interferase toxin, RelE/StbE family [Candidatus Parcubacteria bacterium]|nr:type II toxin-antitoxin system mRNA interferase toxin, RelE/StbE family [Candidatus Parcubacteria bacterium]